MVMKDVISSFHNKYDVVLEGKNTQKGVSYETDNTDKEIKSVDNAVNLKIPIGSNIVFSKDCTFVSVYFASFWQPPKVS